MEALAVVLERPEHLALNRLALTPAVEGDAVVAVSWSGISTGTERLLWSGRMPPFPGMGYPLVPGYESVGTVIETAAGSGLRVGQAVFVPGARCFGEVNGLFGGAASHLIAPAARLVPVDAALGDRACLIALAATAYHAPSGIVPGERNLIVGHGVLGRLLARLTLLAGGTPVVWEREPLRANGTFGYAVLSPDDDPARDYATITDVSGDASLLDTLIGRLAPGMAADLFAIDTRRMDYVGTRHDPLGLIPRVGIGTPVDLTMINGRVVWRKGELVGLDEGRLFAQAEAAWAAADLGIA